ncbi:MAG: ABC transporter ATP-binding protein [Oscillospiraceae bacterium]
MNGLEIRDLNVKIGGGFSLKQINLTVPKGTLLGLVGRNGAGKTSLIKTIADVYAPRSGVILADGISVYDDRPAFFTAAGFAFDESIINERMHFKRMAGTAKAAFPEFDEDFFRGKLEHFGIALNKNLAECSLGMKKKFAVIFALARKPTVLLLDEPTAGVDPADRAELLDMILEFLQDGEHTVLFSTHITSDLDRIADYVALMDGGEILFSREINDLKESYRLIQAERDAFTPEEASRLIGAKAGAFGIEALTADLSLAKKPGVTARMATVEEIMVHFVGRKSGEDAV